jgi:hypothetical protein
MKLEILFIIITSFFAYNTYYDGKYTKMLYGYKKHFHIGVIIIIGLSIYLLLKKNPSGSKNLLLYTNNMIKFLPISKTSIDMVSPVLDLTSSYVNDTGMVNNMRSSSIDKIMNSGKHGGKRSVSETKKKFIASQQNWKCGHCQKQLPAWFEVDHKIRLDNGGSNHVDNLVALCRDCHGRKTAMENL